MIGSLAITGIRMFSPPKVASLPRVSLLLLPPGRDPQTPRKQPAVLRPDPRHCHGRSARWFSVTAQCEDVGVRRVFFVVTVQHLRGFVRTHRTEDRGGPRSRSVSNHRRANPARLPTASWKTLHRWSLVCIHFPRRIIQQNNITLRYKNGN